MDSFYPPVSFYFSVSFEGLNGTAKDVMFQSVSGLNVQMETESIKEGGQNKFEHVVPTRRKYSDLVLKRGVLRPSESEVTQWCKDAFDNFLVEPINMGVSLLDETGKVLMYWKVIHAWPKNWKLSDLTAEKGEVFIETLELNYNYFEFSEQKQ